MYFASIALLLLVLPAIAFGVDFSVHPGSSVIWLVGKWFTFFAVGIRLFVAGVRQNLQPGFTAADIFQVDDPKAFPIVREVGFGNLAIGAAGLLSLIVPGWLPPAAFVGGLYYGLAGIGHLIKPDRNAKENIALVSDVYIAVLLLAFVARVSI
jgi:hypothetical protein